MSLRNSVFFFVGAFVVGMFFLSSPAQAVTCTGPFTDVAGVCVPTTASTGLSAALVSEILLKVMNWLLGILGFLGIIAFVISGMQYLLSAGDDDTIYAAKNNMKYSIIGIIVALSGFVIIKAIDTALKGTSSLF